MDPVSTDLASLYPAHLEHMTHTYLSTAAASGWSGLVIASGALKYAFLDDQAYPFKVNPHFKAWLPLTTVNDSFLLIRAGERPKLLFQQPEDYWHEPPEDPKSYWVDAWDLVPSTSGKDIGKQLGNTSQLAFIGAEIDQARALGFSSINDLGLLKRLHFRRAYKTDYELACLQLANLTAAKGHLVARDKFFQGGSEFEIQQAYLAAIEHREQETPYASIVALNEHCAILHYQHYERHKQTPRSMLIDAGANQCGYAADITRTYGYSGGIFSELIAAMNHAQQAIIAEIKVGINYVTLNRNMHLHLAEILTTFGLVNMSIEAMLETNLTFTFLPHGLGHFIGLQTHDVGGLLQSSSGEEQAAPPAQYPALRLTRIIEDGQVFTIEPGLYFIPILLQKLRQTPHGKFVNWPLVESLISYGGIRIEDNIAIRHGQPINLTRQALAILC